MKSTLVALALLITTPALASIESTFQYLNSGVKKELREGRKVSTLPKQLTPRTSRLHPPEASGKASYYWQGQRTANGERFNPDGVSCAHRTAPFNTILTVTNLSNGKSVRCRVNDRGPFIKGRVVDLSRGAARAIGMISSGVVPVSVH